MRTSSSGDDRKVDLKKDLLVIKLDNTPGKKHDDSVEVEYSDGETNGAMHGMVLCLPFVFISLLFMHPT